MRVFHCSRLIEEEIDDICQHGLRPLVFAHLERRIRRLVALELVSEEIADRLLGEHLAAEPCRAGLLAFITKKSDLTKPDAVGWLLNFWGGEALTMIHASNPITGPVLWSLGAACIFELDRGALRGEPTHRTSSAIPAEQIVEVHRFGSHSFKRLTACDRWSSPFALERPTRELTFKVWEERFGEA